MSFFRHAAPLMANSFYSDSRPSRFPGLPSLASVSTNTSTRESVATMEGALSLPPERGTIIGRALWKVRCSRRCWFGVVMVADWPLGAICSRGKCEPRADASRHRQPGAIESLFNDQRALEGGPRRHLSFRLQKQGGCAHPLGGAVGMRWTTVLTWGPNHRTT